MFKSLFAKKYCLRYKLDSWYTNRYFRSFKAMLRFVKRKKLTKTKFYFLADMNWVRFIMIGNMKVTKSMYLDMGVSLMSEEYDVNLFS